MAALGPLQTLPERGNPGRWTMWTMVRDSATLCADETNSPGKLAEICRRQATFATDRQARDCLLKLRSVGPRCRCAKGVRRRFARDTFSVPA